MGGTPLFMLSSGCFMHVPNDHQGAVYRKLIHFCDMIDQLKLKKKFFLVFFLVEQVLVITGFYETFKYFS